jgi:hypothetical protein
VVPDVSKESISFTFISQTVQDARLAIIYKFVTIDTDDDFLENRNGFAVDVEDSKHEGEVYPANNKKKES